MQVTVYFEFDTRYRLEYDRIILPGRSGIISKGKLNWRAAINYEGMDDQSSEMKDCETNKYTRKLVFQLIIRV